TSYADIFYNNCFKNCILPIVVTQEESDKLMEEIATNEGVKFAIDLETQTVKTEARTIIHFQIDQFRKDNLLKGLDDIGLTLEVADKITVFEEKQKQALPWLWA